MSDKISYTFIKMTEFRAFTLTTFQKSIFGLKIKNTCLLLTDKILACFAINTIYNKWRKLVNKLHRLTFLLKLTRCKKIVQFIYQTYLQEDPFHIHHSFPLPPPHLSFQIYHGL